jgi:outer membrane receptor protein involved in Fe transport
VGVYYDNIPLLSPGAFNSHFYQLDRVDVLRGPQGTLYGANTEAGIVRVYSKDPMTYQGTDVALGFGSGLWRSAEVAHFHRPTEQLAFSVAAFYSGQRGFFKNQNLGEWNDKGNEAGAKLRLMWKPADRLTFDLTTDYQHTNQHAFPYGLLDETTHWAELPSTTVMPRYKRNMVCSGLSVSYRFDELLLTSTTSYQHLFDNMRQDVDYLPADRVQLMQHQRLNGLTEELTLRSTGSGMWQHSSGLFASRQWLRTQADVTFGKDLLDPIAAAIAAAMKSSMIRGMMGRGMSEAAATAAVERMGLHMTASMPTIPSTFELPQLNLAAYHESNLTLWERLTLTLGLRFDYVKHEIDYRSTGSISMTGGTAAATSTGTTNSVLADHLSDTSKQLLPKFGLTYRFSSNGSNLYASVSKGYMAGGYNINLFGDIMRTDLNRGSSNSNGVLDLDHTPEMYEEIANTITYKPEVSWNYELGTHLNLFHNKLHADLAVFYTQLRNQQLTVMAPGTGYGRMTINADKSSTCGLELALRGQAFDDHLTWGATYSFTHATFREFQNEEMVGGQLTTVDYKDNKIPNIPAHMFSALADYRLDLAAGSFLRSITLGANLSGSGKTYWDNANTASQKLYAVLGAHALFGFGIVSVDLWGRNLTATKYCPFAVYNETSGRFIAQRGRPLQVGIDVRLSF